MLFQNLRCPAQQASSFGWLPEDRPHSACVCPPTLPLKQGQGTGVFEAGLWRGLMKLGYEQDVYEVHQSAGDSQDWE